MSLFNKIIDNYLKLKNTNFIDSDIYYLSIIFKIFNKQKEFEKVIDSCNIYLYKLGTRLELNNSYIKKWLLKRAVEIQWVNLVLREDIMYLIKIEEKI
jgi:hypothetical protein